MIFMRKEVYDEYEEILSQAEKEICSQSERRAWIQNKKQEVLKRAAVSQQIK